MKLSTLLQLNPTISNIYIHIPFCIKKCHFCAFPIYAVGSNTSQQQKMVIYNKYCCKLIEQIHATKNMSDNIKFMKNIQSIYFGGGTPSLLSSEQVNSVLNMFRQGINEHTEITLQVNPQQLSKSESFIKQGINRISVGIQTLNSKTLNSLNRSYNSQTSIPLRQQRTYLKYLSKIVNVNLDFIINFNAELTEQKQLINFIDDIKPQHLSLYALEIKEGSFLQRNQQMFSDIIGKYEHYNWLSEQLRKDFGYEHYEVSNFAYPMNNNDGKFNRSKHNFTYLRGDKEFAGFGMGATSLSNGLRVTRLANLRKYYQFVEQLKTGLINGQLMEISDESHWKQRIKWVVLSRLRTKQGMSWTELEQQMEIDNNHKQNIINKCKQLMKSIHTQKEGIIDYEYLQYGMRVTVPNGYLFVDEIGYRLLDCVQS